VTLGQITPITEKK